MAARQFGWLIRMFWIATVSGGLAAEPGGVAKTQRASGETNVEAAPAPPPLPKPPTEFFRRLLTASESEQQTYLESKAPSQRQVLSSKLREYRDLPASECEVRLRALELRWYLDLLIPMASSDRVSHLQAIPEPDRELVQARLELWDRLPADLQKDVLENVYAMSLFARPADTPLALPASHSSPERRVQIEASMKRWKALPRERRQEVYHRFRQMFHLGDADKTRLLKPLSEPERHVMDRTLRLFEQLPREQRDHCIRGFQKFAALSSEQREQFLKSAERWQAMSPEDREVWRALVNRYNFPPMPPGLDPHTPPLPPTLSDR